MDRWYSILLVALAFSLAGCGDDPFSSISGRYELESITIITTTTLTVSPPDITGNFTLNSNGTFSFLYTSTPLNINYSGSGTFVVSGNEITLTHNTGDVETILLSEGGLSLTIFNQVEEGTTLAAIFTKT